VIDLRDLRPKEANFLVRDFEGEALTAPVESCTNEVVVSGAAEVAATFGEEEEEEEEEDEPEVVELGDGG